MMEDIFNKNFDFGELFDEDLNCIFAQENLETFKPFTEHRITKEIESSDDSDSPYLEEFLVKKPESDLSEEKQFKPPSQLPVIIEAGYIPVLRKINNCPLKKVGSITSIICGCLVIKSDNNLPILDCSTALFKENKQPIGEIYEAFGPVKDPYYLVVTSKCTGLAPPQIPFRRPVGYDRDVELKKYHESIESLGEMPDVSVGEAIYYCPDDPVLTLPLLMARLTCEKGSDASWLNDREIPENLQEFSDDEAERNFKKSKKNKNSSIINLPEGRNQKRNFESSQYQDRNYRVSSSVNYNNDIYNGYQRPNQSRGSRNWPPSERTPFVYPNYNETVQRPTTSNRRSDFDRKTNQTSSKDENNDQVMEKALKIAVNLLKNCKSDKDIDQVSKSQDPIAYLKSLL